MGEKLFIFSNFIFKSENYTRDYVPICLKNYSEQRQNGKFKKYNLESFNGLVKIGYDRLVLVC